MPFEDRLARVIKKDAEFKFNCDRKVSTDSLMIIAIASLFLVFGSLASNLWFMFVIAMINILVTLFFYIRKTPYKYEAKNIRIVFDRISYDLIYHIQ